MVQSFLIFFFISSIDFFIVALPQSFYFISFVNLSKKTEITAIDSKVFRLGEARHSIFFYILLVKHSRLVRAANKAN